MRGSGTATGSAPTPSTSTGANGCWRGTSSASGQPRSVLLWGLLAGGARRGSEFLGETGPAGVDHLVRVVGRQVVEPLTAVDAEAGAVVGADRRERQVQHDGVAGERLEVEEVALEVADLVLLAGRLGGATGV